MVGSTADGQLIVRIRDGDVSALGDLYDRYRLPVFRVALAITRDRKAAEDILQRSFIQLNARAGSIDASAPLAPWLYRIATDLSYAWVTQHSRWWTPLEGLIDRFDRLVAPVRLATRPEADMRALQDHIDRAVDILPLHQRVVVILYYLGGLSLKEIAYILECPVGTAKSRLHYGREALRAQLAHGAEAPAARPAVELAYELV